MPDVDSQPFERLVNGESSVGTAAAAAATGAVSGDGGGTKEGEDSCVGGGGSGGSVSGVSFCIDGAGNNDSVGSVGTNNSVPAVAVTGGAAGGAFTDVSRNVTLLDARGTTPVSSRCGTTVPRICGGGCRCCISVIDLALSSSSSSSSSSSVTCVTARTSDGNRAGDSIVTTDCRFTLSSVGAIATRTLTLDAGSINAKTVSRSGVVNNTAVVIVDTESSVFHDVDVDEEDDEEEVHYQHYNRGNMVAAMNDHLSSGTTTTTSSSPAAANAIRATGNTAAMSSSSAMMTANNTIGGINSVNSTVVAMSNAIGPGLEAGVIGNSNSYSGARSQEFQEMDGNDGKTATTTGGAGILSFPCDFDHMYASMTDGDAPATVTATSALGVSPLRGNEPRQNDLTEVKHLKELLLLHLDLIQQQSEQIVTKDKLLAALRQENETLKLRLERMERRVSLQKLKTECNENSTGLEHLSACSPPSVNSVSAPSTSELHRNVQCDSSNTLHESFKIRLNTSGGITTVKQEPVDNQIKVEIKQEPNETRFEWDEKKKRRLDQTAVSTGGKKKRAISCSSTVSNDGDKVLSQIQHEISRKSDRKAKSLTKKESFLTTEEHYFTAVGDTSYTLSLKQFGAEANSVETNSSLEVPNWRVKVYTSCYTMEGTENLDDEIFNKRHLKLENDERRRKRWDVQRIREQRHIEKLKQRQERQNHQATCYNINHTGPCPSSAEEETVTSLWPDVEQIQSLQVDPHLPVTAFGAPISSFTPSEFSLPWSNITRIKCRRPKRLTGRRKSTSRRKV